MRKKFNDLTHNLWPVGLIVLLVGILLILTLNQIGITYDEPIYFYYSNHYIDWLKYIGRSWAQGDFARPFEKASIDLFWKDSDSSAPLAKFLAGLTWKLFRNVIGGLAAYRLSAAFFFSLLLIFLYLFLLQNYDKKSAIFASLALVTMPRVFGHAHFAALDMPITTLWFLTTYAFWNGAQNWRWSLVTGIFFGLALLTKINAIAIPVGLILWGIICRKRLKNNLLAMIFISPVIFVLGWPRMWYDTLARLKEYFSFYLAHYPVPVYYFGKQFYYSFTPWHYPIILFLITLPLPILLLIFYGAFKGMRQKMAKNDQAKGETKLFLIINGIMPILALSLPWFSKYDGVRLFLPVFPFMAALAGIGFSSFVTSLENRNLWPNNAQIKNFLAGGLGILLLLPGVLSTISFHPYEPSYYNELIGGFKGAENSGMETTYWGESIVGALKYLNENLPNGARIVVLNSNDAILKMYQQNHLLRSDFRIVGNRTEDIVQADIIILVPRQGMFDELSWKLYLKTKPAFAVRLKGVPLLLVYEASKLPK